MNARESALKVLHKIDVEKAYSNIALNHEIKHGQYTKLDRNFITELVYGTLENCIFIDYILQQFSTTKLNKMDTWTLNLLRLSIYQIFFLDKVPDFAAVNESVNLSKKYCKRASGFINGVLRSIIRNKESIKMPNKEKELAKYLSIKYSHPKWMVERFLKYFSEDFTEGLLKSNNETPKLCIRVNILKTNVEEVVQLLLENEIKVEKSPFISEALMVEGGFSELEVLDIYKKGLIHIQDFSSMLAAKILDPKENQFVIDVCSAPGGKTTHIAQLMKNKGRVLARDIHSHKLNLIEKNAKRLNIDIIEVEKFNGKDLDHQLLNAADKVLVDAPCSGLGIIRRKPEIKYRKEADDIRVITEMQLKILINASKYVKTGGELLYSTCTIDPNENDKVIEKFLNLSSDYEVINISQQYGRMLPGNHKEKMIQLYPNIHGTDGFFICKLRKK
ncbi:16S rRNA (cytosine(967)-C(5))-methyltransferase RsmB [Clostridium formicaceticum]|uniref:16S rRNA (cytosine(967)-C(5))-methyltransferase n=1 Tax=Clostridium formicaceticum TaxID=1497 RepID=A0AAC9WGK0_9CLOT|nr:16S rRNA (cytosine(967)-C(5))-methyltransferase RsmB [Clostridium formicaceticum]AOY77369.1 16S rRNA (cytosine(967)-C(5))-methyltransferase [Clostridium formicaceticum]ARE87916.1 Ribosomal RNA small subunit methyltransferase B [Clostridium formicaceticum]